MMIMMPNPRERKDKGSVCLLLTEAHTKKIKTFNKKPAGHHSIATLSPDYSYG